MTSVAAPSKRPSLSPVQGHVSQVMSDASQRSTSDSSAVSSVSSTGATAAGSTTHTLSRRTISSLANRTRSASSSAHNSPLLPHTALAATHKTTHSIAHLHHHHGASSTSASPALPSNGVAASAPHHNGTVGASAQQAAATAPSMQNSGTAVAASSSGSSSAVSASSSNVLGGGTFNTELRAQARREREASREKLRERGSGTHLQQQHHQPLPSSSASTVASAAPSSSNVGAHHHPSAGGRERGFSSAHSSAATTAAEGQAGSCATSAPSVTAHSSIGAAAAKKISPRLGAKANVASSVASSASAPSSRHAMSNRSQHPSLTSRSSTGAVNGASDMTVRSNVSSSTRATSSGASGPVGKSSDATQVAGTMLTTQDALPSALHGIEGLITRIPSPPKLNGDQAGEQVSQYALLAEQYYDLLEKCRSWQRYATSMKEKADHLEIENRFLRDTSRKHEEEVQALERQLHGLKETAMLLDEERRRTESRMGLYTAAQSGKTASQQQSRRPALRHPSAQQVRRPSETTSSLAPPSDVPSPPSDMSNRQASSSDYQSNSGVLSTSARLRAYSSSSDVRDAGEMLQQAPSALHPYPTGPIDAPPYDMHLLAQQQQLQAQAHVHARIHSHAMHAHHRHDSNLIELLAQDAAHREAAALHEATVRQQHQHLARNRTGITESRSFPPSDVTQSAALTTQALAAHGREHHAALALNRLPSSSSAPMLRAAAAAATVASGELTGHSAKDQASHTLRHQVSEGNAMAGPTPMVGSKRQDLHHADDKQQLQGLGLQHVPAGIVKGLMQEYNLRNANGADADADKHSEQARTRLSNGATGSAAWDNRSASAQSDAKTVTNDYLQGVVEQKRQLRKISQSQQQQLLYLQSKVQSRPSSSLGGATGGAGKGNLSDNLENIAPPATNATNGLVGSRPSSRLSNHGGARGKMRSRTGSYSFHDAIPVDKDDVFSSQEKFDSLETEEQKTAVTSSRRTIQRSGSVPLGQVSLNGRSGAMSALELRHYADPSGGSDASQSAVEDEIALQGLQHLDEGQSAEMHSRSSSQEDVEAFLREQQRAPSDSSGSAGLAVQHLQQPDNDPKGAHRRLYIRLREELTTPELQRFERYVHKYDALLIEMEGAKGIINRVRRLLLPEPIVRAKQSQRDRYQQRKELAREFERIVRDDAVPSDVTTSSQNINLAAIQANQLQHQSSNEMDLFTAFEDESPSIKRA